MLKVEVQIKTLSHGVIKVFFPPIPQQVANNYIALLYINLSQNVVQCPQC